MTKKWRWPDQNQKLIHDLQDNKVNKNDLQENEVNRTDLSDIKSTNMTYQTQSQQNDLQDNEVNKTDLSDIKVKQTWPIRHEVNKMTYQTKVNRFHLWDKNSYKIFMTFETLYKSESFDFNLTNKVTHWHNQDKPGWRTKRLTENRSSLDTYD